MEAAGQADQSTVRLAWTKAWGHDQGDGLEAARTLQDA